jgi:hypothetical protein
MEQLIPAAIGLISSLLATTKLTTPLVTGIIDVVTAATPVIIKEYKDLKPIVSNIIAVVKADPATQADQLEALKKAEVQYDADFEAAASAALAEDAEVTKN